MDFSDNILTCSVNIEWLNAQGIVQRKITHKSGTVRLIRNEFRQMFVEVSSTKTAAVKLQLKGITVHNKFMNEGKASIKFQDEKCTMFLSNVPPNQLKSFLRTIFVKMTGEKANNLNTSLRTKLLSNKPKSVEEISPVTLIELENAKKKVSKTTDTTPSPGQRKRKLSDENKERPTSSKRLYTASPLLEEPLTIEQKEIMEACLSGKNVFFTGSAGTGKSYLLKKIIGALPPDVTVATASTGVAACQIGGITLHQFAGIGSGEFALDRCVEIASKPASTSIWRKCKHLIIDEISMVDGEYFEKIEHVARKVRRNEKPFGGIKLILCGDFFQLPPVRKDVKNQKKRFCFQTKAWTDCVQLTYELKKIHRQNDEEFCKILNLIRLGQVTDYVTEKLKNTASQKIEMNGILATRLCSHTNDANIINESKLDALQGEKMTYNAEDSEKHLSKQLDQQTAVPSKLELKIGAQVMLLKNINLSLGLVNGARGVVKNFKNNLPIVQFRNKEYIAKHEKWTIKTANGGILTRSQIPLKLAWAFSIHKSQGLTLDCVEMSLGKVFEAGQAYVALSRASSLETLRVLDFSKDKVWANPDVLNFYRNLRISLDCRVLKPLGERKLNNSNNKRVSLKSKLMKMMDKPLLVIK